MSKIDSPDSLCEKYANRNVKVSCKMLDDNTILLEGEREALEFLGNLLLAQARFELDCGFQIGPHGAGCALFTEESNMGIYIHRLPCIDGEVKGIGRANE